MTSDDDNDDKTVQQLVDRAADLFVFAPIGLFFEVPSLLHRLAQQGRVQVRNARMFGEHAVRRGEARVRRHVGDLEGALGRHGEHRPHLRLGDQDRGERGGRRPARLLRRLQHLVVGRGGQQQLPDPGEQPLPSAHQHAGRIEEAVRERCPSLADVIVHTEP